MTQLFAQLIELDVLSLVCIDYRVHSTIPKLLTVFLKMRYVTTTAMYRISRTIIPAWLLDL
ncbi:MAG: hypothetical protein DHS20C01_17430 [marine bacterium B5-7]|nr:MAG: hypothetical protein DHS20C01_17430 [marine bacterium B5-7]